MDILYTMTLSRTVRRIGTRYLASKATAYAVGAIVGGGIPGLVVGWAAQRYVVPRVVAAAEGAIECLMHTQGTLRLGPIHARALSPQS